MSPTRCSPSAKGIFGKRLVAGAFVFSAGLGLVATNCVNAFSYGYDKLRFIKPVFIGDTIYTIRTHLEKRPKYKELGLIRASYQVFKGEGELVLYCEHLQTVKYRDASAFAAFFEDRHERRTARRAPGPRLILTSECGFRHVPLDITRHKLAVLVEASRAVPRRMMKLAEHLPFS